MWTLLKQSPSVNKSEIDKAIVVCPSSLVRNWANELVKWLGEGVLNPLAIDGKMSSTETVKAIRQWCASKGKQVVTPGECQRVPHPLIVLTQVFTVVIVSYEKLRMLQDELGTSEVGLLLADEGHRLKNSDNQTYTALNQINCKRRVILTGTPIQVSHRRALASAPDADSISLPRMISTNISAYSTSAILVTSARSKTSTSASSCPSSKVATARRLTLRSCAVTRV